MPDSFHQAEALKNAFDQFNHASERLADSYQHLGQRFGRLTETLSANDAALDPLDSYQDILTTHLSNHDFLFDASLIDGLPTGVLVVDGNGRIVFTNKKAGSLIGKQVLGELWSDIVAQYFTEMVFGNEFELENNTIVNLSMHPLDMMPGQSIVLHDVTETRRLNTMIDKKNRVTAMATVAGNISHQIKTPLATVMLQLSKLENEVMDRDERLNLSVKLKRHIVDICSLVDEMLVFSKGIDGTAKEVSIDAVWDGVLMLAKPLLDNAPVQYEFSKNIDEAIILGNKELYVSIILNIIVNAIESCESKVADDHCIKVSVDYAFEGKKDKQCVIIKVSDTGKGFSEEYLHSPDQSFYTTKKSGNGIGLAVARSVINAWGGALSVKNTGTGAEVGLVFSPAGIE